MSDTTQEATRKSVSPKTANLATKLLAIMDDIGGYVQKDGRNVQQKYNYVSEAAILEKVQPAMIMHRIICVPNYKIISSEDKATSNGAIWKLVTVELQLMLINADNTEQTITVTAIGSGVDPNDKGVAKAQTMAYKYAWWKLLCLATGDDPEEDSKPDKTTFVENANKSVVNNPGTVTDVIVDPISQNPVQELEKIWTYAGWDVSGLAQYLTNRFRKPVNEITISEYASLIKELVKYLNDQGRTISEMPF